MKRTRYTEEQFDFTLHQIESRTPVADVTGKIRINRTQSRVTGVIVDFTSRHTICDILWLSNIFSVSRSISY
ncbi:hypothetical protein GmarT_20260 [Gimesia maris]|uniref:Uncharacterized protein n=1 Tax=Gimesia maris TaxID=122 RepID=A0ABX5YKL1_9PLAN|nr:hypothetical protein CA11_19490 [Gimesia maris]QEG16165.1 hypothetical protein GmarT_20260 [Gimesia maris]